MKRGFSIIELIVSIVVIGIVFLSVPTILFQNARNNETSIIQQSVMDTKTRLALVLKTPWGCTNDLTLVNLPTPIFGGLPNFYDRNGITRDRTRTFSTIARDSACQADQEQDINSFNNDEITITAPIGPGENGYSRDNILNQTLNTSVANVDMTGTANNNIKEISITTTATLGNTNQTILLRAYSSNIGDSPALELRQW